MQALIVRLAVRLRNLRRGGHGRNPVFSEHRHVEGWATRPIESLQVRADILHRCQWYLFGDEHKSSIVASCDGILKNRVNRNIVLLTNFTTLACNADLVAVANANVKYAVVVIHEDSLFCRWIESHGCFVSLGEGDNVIHT